MRSSYLSTLPILLCYSICVRQCHSFADSPTNAAIDESESESESISGWDVNKLLGVVHSILLSSSSSSLNVITVVVVVLVVGVFGGLCVVVVVSNLVANMGALACALCWVVTVLLNVLFDLSASDTLVLRMVSSVIAMSS